MNPNDDPKFLFIEESVKNEPLTKNIVEHLPHLKARYIEDLNQINFSEIQVQSGHEIMVVAKQKGRFLKECPCTKDVLSCGYFILESAVHCNFGCTYCVLQSYLNCFPMIIYANLQDMLDELTGVLDQNPDAYFRIGTGELTDSLSMDLITGFSKWIIPYFAQKKNACLELKTKSTAIENLEKINHQGKTIISWSLIPEKIALKEELRAPSITERLHAAQQCQQWGYPLSFHFEPTLFYDGWEKDYEVLIDQLFKYVRPEQIIWISLGGLRLLYNLKEIAEEKFPNSSYFYEEFIPGSDGKLRYLKNIRIDLYRKISKWIRSYGDIPIYLCMEPQDVWEKGLGLKLSETDQVEKLLGNKISRL